MKKQIIIIILAIGLLNSCSSENEKNIDSAAKKICSCLDEIVSLNQQLAEQSESGDDAIIIETMKKISNKADLGFNCIQKAKVRYKVAKDPTLLAELTQRIEQDCPDVAEIIAREN